MAIYHYSAQIIGRSKGHSATAAAAYRAGAKIKDEQTGTTYDYTKKGGVYGTEIIAPDNVPEWVYNREKLWNEIEKAEKQCNSQLAREINVALPVELTPSQMQELVRDFVKEQFVDKGMIADVCYHDLEASSDGSEHNPHAHIMLTMRAVNEEGFGLKNRSWNK